MSCDRCVPDHQFSVSSPDIHLMVGLAFALAVGLVAVMVQANQIAGSADAL